MVQFTLPKNSKVTEGKTWPHPAKAKPSANTASIAGIRTTGAIRASTPIMSIPAIAGRWFSTR